MVKNLLVMRKILLIYALAATLAGDAALALLRRTVSENHRLKSNQTALIERIERSDTVLDTTRASVEVLRLRCREYEALHAEDAATIRQLGLRLRRVERVAKEVTATAVAVQTPLRDTLIVRRDTGRLYDTLRRFAWRDPWVLVEGEIRRDTLRARIESVDTLHQILHRVPRRFLFFRWGTKGVRQEVRTSNPHTRLVYADYVAIER